MYFLLLLSSAIDLLEPYCRLINADITVFPCISCCCCFMTLLLLLKFLVAGQIFFSQCKTIDIMEPWFRLVIFVLVADFAYVADIVAVAVLADVADVC